jgi:uncharacterized protein
MEPEIQSDDAKHQEKSAEKQSPEPPLFSSLDSLEYGPRTTGSNCHGMHSIFTGSDGLRTGWSAVLFVIISIFLIGTIDGIVLTIYPGLINLKNGSVSITAAVLSELISFVSIVIAGFLLALIEGRHLRDYYLSGPRRLMHFASGLIAGFVAISILVGAMALGGWMNFGTISLSGTQIIRYAIGWGIVFLLTGFFEEGAFRCYLQYTLTRGINFWIALVIVAAICGYGSLVTTGHSSWGIYIAALLGMIPCLVLHLKKIAHSSFWQASWATSTLFGALHIANGGESWFGITTASLVGFLFCISIWLTGSAWWAIGCHASWDWAESYFYGVANSGMVAKGHLLSATPVGNTLWSGGSSGPEGSLLVIPTLLLLFLSLVALYGRRKTMTVVPAAEEASR